VAPAVALATVTIEGRKSCQCRDLLSAQVSDLRQRRNQGPGDDVPHTFGRLQQLVARAKVRALVDTTGDLLFDRLDLYGERLDERGDAFLDAAARFVLANLFGRAHGNELPSTRDRRRSYLCLRARSSRRYSSSASGLPSRRARHQAHALPRRATAEHLLDVDS
jgi:hypothetical protein